MTILTSSASFLVSSTLVLSSGYSGGFGMTLASGINASLSYVAETVVSNTVEANAVINALPAYNSKVVVSDIFTELGGESLGNNYFEGEYTTLFDNLHPSASGHKVIGESIARKIRQNL